MALLLGFLAGAAFASLAVAVRFGLVRGVDAETGAAAGSLVATGLSAAVAFAAGASWGLPAGISLAVAYDALIGAFGRGRVTIVAPLDATQSLWAVVFSFLLIRRNELIGLRVVAAAGLVVAGGAVIGVFR